MLHHCARSAPRHLRHDVAKGDNVYIYSSFCFNSSVIVTSPSLESWRVFCQAKKSWKFTMKRKRSERGFDTEEFQRVHGILWNAIYVKLVHKNTSYLVNLFSPGIWGWLVLIIRNKFALLLLCDIFFWSLFVKLCFSNMICNKVHEFAPIVTYIIIFEKIWFRLILTI